MSDRDPGICRGCGINLHTHIDGGDEHEANCLASRLDGVCAQRDAAWAERSELSSRLSACEKSLRGFVDAAKSWHDFHHGSCNIACDWFCENIPAGEAALAGSVVEKPLPIGEPK